jgi:DNA-binding PadR family transcriptional regulator
MKLSPAQLRVLTALNKPGERAHFMKGLDSYWFLSNTYKRLYPGTIDVLEKNGFITISMCMGYSDIATITPAGRDYLKRLKEEDDGKG